MENKIQKGLWIPLPGLTNESSSPVKKELKKLDDHNIDEEVREIVLDLVDKCTQEIVNECCNSGIMSPPSADLKPCKRKKLTEVERAFYNRTLSILKRAQNEWGQKRSTAGAERPLNQTENQIDREEFCETKFEDEMREIQDANSGLPNSGSNEATQKREALIKKLNDLENTHKSLKQALGVQANPQSGTEGLMERIEYAECKNQEYECKLRDQDVIIDRLRRQIQCEKDYVTSLSRMQAQMEETRACLQRELLSKAQEVERSTVQVKNLQSQMCGHINEVERLQEFVDQTTKKSECEKELMKKSLKVQQDQLAQTEDALQKAVIRIENMEAENNVLTEELKRMTKELDALRPEAEAKKQLEEVCSKLQNHLRELQPLPELLKTTELKLQEERAKNQQCEQRVLEQARIIHELTAKIDGQISTLKCMKDKVDQIAAENAQLQCKIDNLNQQVYQGQATISELNSALHLKNELINQMTLKLEDRDVHTLNINRQLEEALAESNRLSCLVEERTAALDAQNKTRVKEIQDQLSAAKQEVKQLKLEKQEMECKYGRQMNDLREKMEQCDMATHSMQSYIAYLKTSYASVFNDPNLTAACNPAAIVNRESGI